MVARRPKLIAAGMVLAAGVALAWPLRRDEPLPLNRRGVAASAAPVETAATPADAAIHATANPLVASVVHEPAPHLAEPDVDPFANVPPSASEPAASQTSVFSTISSAPVQPPPSANPEPPKHRIHVVHEGDSLDRLAKRYLGDEARALEIFDLNREVLANPHLLPLGIELKIPMSACPQMTQLKNNK